MSKRYIFYLTLLTFLLAWAVTASSSAMTTVSDFLSIPARFLI